MINWSEETVKGARRVITVEDLYQARSRLNGHVHHTPLERQATLSERTGKSLYLKLENLQKTGSFKLRGALNRIQTLSPQQRAAGVVAASAGNHAQGVALAARQAGVKSVIIMPRWAPVSKVAATRAYGAEVILSGETYDDAYDVAVGLAAERRLSLVHAFDDEAVIAGQATVGAEILDDLPNVDTIVVPVGGGGLIAGIALYAKAVNPRVRIIGVEAEGAASVARSLARGMPEAPPIQLEEINTIADGIAVKRPGRLTYPVIQRYVDEIVTVSDEEIAGVILTFIERLKLVVEGAGAAAVAAVVAGKVRTNGKDVVAVVSGGNIDVDMIARIIERGLVATGRRLRLRVRLQDRPGALHRLTGEVARAMGNILGIDHDRTNATVPVGATEVLLHLAVQDRAHGDALTAQLRSAGYEVEVV